MQQLSRREKYFVCNTLNCLPVLLIGKSVLVDLKNEISVAGRIDSADGNMNIHLTGAVLIDRNGLQYHFMEMMVRERFIRQIHLPNSLDMDAELHKWMEHGIRRPSKTKSNKKRTFKLKRAEMRHKEILTEIYEKKE